MFLFMAIVPGKLFWSKPKIKRKLNTNKRQPNLIGLDFGHIFGLQHNNN